MPASRRAKGNKHPRFVLLSNQREKERGMKRLKGNGSLAEGKIMSSDNLTKCEIAKCRVGLNLLPSSLIVIEKKCPIRMFTDCNNYNEERRERELITAVVIRVSPSQEEGERGAS